MGSAQTLAIYANLLCGAAEAGSGTESSGSVEVKYGKGANELGTGSTGDK